MKVPERTFVTEHATPGPSPLWIGLFGPSGSGKTFTALELATGIAAVTGGPIHLIDTESGRGKHYADRFDYEYTSFPPPHGSLDYLAAIRDAVNKGAKVIIVDSFSHEHEGAGGLVEFHEEEHKRMGGTDSVKMLAWTKPKAARKQLLREMIQMKVVFILCFRADESAKPGKDDKGKMGVVQLGFMPIAGKPFVYEATVCAFLPPASNGVPQWNPENAGEKLMKKLPIQFRDLFSKPGVPLSRDHGRKLAEWAKGGAAARQDAREAATPSIGLLDRVKAYELSLRNASTPIDVEGIWRKAAKLYKDADTDTQDRMQRAYEGRLNEVQESA